jgi:hypothetical protein
VPGGATFSPVIPARLHFVWLGKSLPLFVQLAMESALRATPGARATLWHDTLTASALGRLTGRDDVELAAIDARALFGSNELDGELLARTFAELAEPAARANLVRLAVLLQHGGVYLDADTLTLRDLTPLLSLDAFCGLEHVVWPLERRYALSAYRVLGGPLRGLLRDACAQLPAGERLFAGIARHYHLAANNAVLGFTAGHPFLVHMLRKVGELGRAERLKRYRLGTHLLQESLREVGGRHGVHELAPRWFYPLGPEISRQYFRKRHALGAAIARIVGADTHVVHWYASLAELGAYDEARIRAEREESVFAALCARVLD